MLAQCGLLKFMQAAPRMSLEQLLKNLVGLWDVGAECFIIQGQHLEITM